MLYHDTKREVVQQCIANLTSQFHAHYEHEEVIAASYERTIHGPTIWNVAVYVMRTRFVIAKL